MKDTPYLHLTTGRENVGICYECLRMFIKRVESLFNGKEFIG